MPPNIISLSTNIVNYSSVPAINRVNEPQKRNESNTSELTNVLDRIIADVSP